MKVIFLLAAGATFGAFADGSTPADGARPAAPGVEEMDRLVVAEQDVSARLLPLAERDSRLGFHSEAESHLYHPSLLRWRIGRLAGTRRRIAEIADTVAKCQTYPESEFERTAPKVTLGGDWVTGKDGFRFKVARAGADRLRVTAQVPKRQPFLALSLDEVGATLYQSVKVFPDGHWETYGFNRVPLKPSAIADLRVTELTGEAWEATYTMEETDARKCFLIGDRPKTPPVTLRDDGVTLVGGKPFFPIGIYAVNKRDFNAYNWDRAISDLKDGGFNFVRSHTAWSYPAFHAMTAKYGLKMWMMGHTPAKDPMFIDKCRDSPWIVAWYLGDDTSRNTTVSELYDREDNARAVDPTRISA